MQGRGRHEHEPRQLPWFGTGPDASADRSGNTGLVVFSSLGCGGADLAPRKISHDFRPGTNQAVEARVQAAASPALSDLLEEAEASVMQENAERDAHIAAWGEAYRGFGAKPNRTPCSAAALLKRSQKDGALPRISPLVDAYNAISVLYGVPVGGEDLDRYSVSGVCAPLIF